MKKLLALMVLICFTLAVCHAVPSHGSDPPKTEMSKKYFELQVFEAPVVFEVPAAPAVVYDLIVPDTRSQSTTVVPQSNGPPVLMMARTPVITELTYSMARWRPTV